MNESASDTTHSTDTICSTLPVMESFYTIQGEGFHQGRAAYFLRLGGCDVRCTWCDVKESWNASAHPQIAIENIVTKALKESGIIHDGMNVTPYEPEPLYVEEEMFAENWQSFVENRHQSVTHWSKDDYQTRPLVVVTGGEPLLHDLDDLTHQLHLAGFETNMETSGSSPLSGDWDWICVSPKKFKAPLHSVLSVANELKVVIFNKSDFEWAEKYAAQVSSHCKLYLQPEWSKSSSITPLIIEYIKSNPQWELSLQIHKYINIP